MASKSIYVALIAAVVIAAGSVLFFSNGAESDPPEKNIAQQGGPATPPPAAQPADSVKGVLSKLPDGAPPPHVQPSPEANTSFESVKECFFRADRRQALQTALVQCESLKDIEDVRAQYEMCSVETPKLQRELAELAQNDACPASEGKAAERYFSETREAAIAGVADAQLCFVESQFGDVPFDDEDAAEYDRLAPGFVEQAFKRGDWRVAALLLRNAATSHTGFLHRISDNSLQTRLRMNRLLRLGAEGKLARILDSEAQLFQAASQDETAPVLTPSQALEADRWASDVYTSYFQRSPRLEKLPSICGP
jgi:hypothetical protein